MPHRLAIHWFRRDLRLMDNPALLAALSASDGVVPVYIRSTWKDKHPWTGATRQAFLCESLASLDANLRHLGSRLVVRSGMAVAALRELIGQTRAEAVYFNRDVDPFGKETERQVQTLCRELGIACHAFLDATLHGPGEVLTQSGTPFRVYTPFSRAWLSLDKPAPSRRPRSISTPGSIPSDPLPTLDSWGLKDADAASQRLPGGEKAARARLQKALKETIPAYAQNRNRPGAGGTSRLSQDLRFGLLSIREIFAKVDAARRAAETEDARRGHEVFIQELAWREFYMAVLHHFPSVLDEEFQEDTRGMPWQEDAHALEAWKAGRTGFPIVDAGMRELRATGYMHNRIRMIVSMFLTKDLHLDWRLGERYFMQQLVDGEIASNNGGWQWSAGTGADAAPYFRIQNPWSQTKRHDPDGTYIRRWVPELAETPASALCAPPADDRPLAHGYPLPRVDHARERQVTLDLFKSHKGK